MDNTLEYATTPLALASLIAILVIGVLKVLVSKKNNALNRLITHYGFTLVLLFGLLGNGAYLYDSYQSSETLIIGTVVDKKSGKYLPRVQIDTGGHARGMTSDTGDFVLAIPKSRIADQYQVSASLDGYERLITRIENESKMFVRFELEEVTLDLNSTMQVADKRIIIGHYLGLPDIQIQIKFDNPLTAQIVFKDLQVEVVSPSGKSRRLVQVAAGIDSYSPPLPPLPNIYVNPTQKVQYLFRFIQYDNKTHQLALRAQASLQSDSNFQQRGPQIGTDLMSQKLTQDIVSAMNTSWFWEVGESTVNVSANIDGEAVKFSRVVKILPDQIKVMKASSDYYQSGFGVFQPVSLMPVGSAVPAHQIESSAP
ncbi:MAG: hypothetical protein OEZ68_19450 [Gammaproteobacteria bacterium]|nr:hypothetical protein [Gammaproteobacteria bacterium]MDH5802986.1 hypothetical protein [Gammaproteobacteria bacterium]